MNHNTQEERERLRAMLEEDIGDADSVLNTVEMLKRWQAPQPAPEQTQHLIAEMKAELVSPILPNRIWPLLLIYSQIRVVRREIWWATALVMLLGTVVTLITYSTSNMTLLPMAILAPIVASLGVGLLYDQEFEQMLELENSTLASAQLLLLARLTLVFGFNLLLALLASAVLAVVSTEISLWPLVMSWLGPMTFLSALAFVVSIVAMNAVLGALVSITLWMMHVVLPFTVKGNEWVALISLPGLSLPETRPLLFIGAAVLLAIGFWMTGRSERVYLEKL